MMFEDQGMGSSTCSTRTEICYGESHRAGVLNAPWGMAVSPPDFGRVSGALLVGNFGNGVINAFNVNTGNFLGRLNGPDGVHAIRIDGLWGLKFGNGVRQEIATRFTFLPVPTMKSTVCLARS